ncbi:hypothetical protein [Polaromonas sp. JS666]|uniref:hypothetical protein n=1 Tax=Polaromonas sp. (strain JS666 / ATCC BAA-500) TaxID=296591 RepID=UPI00059B85A2|nr:hypothetical protein [Polaromonas sp. JS666]
MYRALLTVVLNVCIASASVSVSAFAATPVGSAPHTLTSDAAARVARQREAQNIKINTKLSEGQSRRPPPPSTAHESTAGDSEDNPYATLLITLVLMGAIALRRRGSGRP